MKVFISHSSLDKKFVRTLKADLKENGIETWVDEDELEFGDTLAEKLEMALEQSSHFLIVLSEASVNSEWVEFELQRAMNHMHNESLRKIIPIKYKNCIVPQVLQNLLFADLTEGIRQIQGDSVSFTSNIYGIFLERLCKAIKRSESQLSINDKLTIKTEFIKETKDSISSHGDLVKANYLLIVHNREPLIA